MSQRFYIHPKNTKQRLLEQAAKILRAGGTAAYPTDSCYAIGCHIGEQQAVQRIRQLRGLDKNHNMTLICRDLADISSYARLDNHAFRLMKSLTPGPYTFILRATADVPRRLQHPKRKSIGLRIPDHPVLMDLLDILGQAMISTSLILPGAELPLSNADDIVEHIGKQIDLVIDCGPCSMEPTTVIDLTTDEPTLVRQGIGPWP